jgi:phage-related protein (TIGR01555 family)
MARKGRRNHKTNVNNNVSDRIQSFAQDAFSNPLARTGFGTPSLMEATQYSLTRFTRDWYTLTSLYRSNWIAQRIIELPPQDMCKSGIKYTFDLAPEALDKIQKLEKKSHLWTRLREGLEWGRLYGGAAGLMLIDGQPDLEQPLDLDAIMPGDFYGLEIVDRWSGIWPQIQLVTDFKDPDYGQPEYYHFGWAPDGQAADTEYGIKDKVRVHHSRVVPFRGIDLPRWERVAEMYWGASILEPCFEEIRKRDNTSANIAGLIFMSNLRVLKMEDLGEVLGATNQNVQRDFMKTIQAQAWLQSNFGMYLLSAKDDFQTFTTSFGGLNEIYESFMMDISGAAQIPVTKLFGRSPAGMNATGESDENNYYNMIHHQQESRLRPALEKILPVMFMSALGDIPDELDFNFNPVQPPNPEDIGNVVKWKTEAVINALNAGLISPQVAGKEIQAMRDDTGMFTNLTDEDVNKLDTEPNPMIAPMDEMGDNESEGGNEN